MPRSLCTASGPVTLVVTDQVTGAVKTYRRGAPDGTELCGEADTSAFR
jgi:hypothetical protein